MSELATRKFIAKQLQIHTIKAVAVIGGDGTTSSVIQALAGTNTPIAIFPTGSGNDTAKAFQLTKEPKEFIAGLVAGRTTAIDLLKLNDRFGITIAGTGIDALIGNRVNQSFYKPILNKLRMGSLTYTIAAVLSLLSFKPFNGTITIDDVTKPLNKTWLIACGNTSSYGGGLTICPTADPTDGRLNVTLIHEVGRLYAILHIFPSLLRGRPIHNKGVSYIEGKEIKITTDRPIPVIIDGEIITTTPWEIKVYEKALLLILTT